MELQDITNTTLMMQVAMTAATGNTRNPTTVLRRSQLQFLNVFKFQLRRRRRFGTVLLERRDGVDGIDSLQLKREWSIARRERVFSVTVPRETFGTGMLPWRHYEVYTITSDFMTGRHNIGLAALTTADPIRMTTEIIVARRGMDRGRFADMGITERKTAKTIVVSVARRILELDQGVGTDVLVTESRYQLARA